VVDLGRKSLVFEVTACPERPNCRAMPNAEAWNGAHELEEEAVVAFDPADHYALTGMGIDAVVDTSGLAGAPVVSLSVDGRQIRDPSFTTTQHGIVVDATVESVPDSHSLEIRLTFPEVNVSEEYVTFTGFAALTRALTSIGGPRLISGALYFYELRPVAGTASRATS
jgi:hypothetical protein